MSTFTYAEAEQTFERALTDMLKPYGDTVHNNINRYHDIEFRDVDTYGIHQVWHDNTHLIKRYVFQVPKKKIYNYCKEYHAGNKANLEFVIGKLLSFAVDL